MMKVKKIEELTKDILYPCKNKKRNHFWWFKKL